jgi:hypothetical protein
VEPEDQQDRRLCNRHEQQRESQMFGHYVTLARSTPSG